MEGYETRKEAATNDSWVSIELGKKQQVWKRIAQSFDLEAIQKLVIFVIAKKQLEAFQR